MQLGRELRRRGHGVRVVCLYPHRGIERLPLEADDVCFGWAEDHMSERMPGFNPRLLRALGDTISAFRPDIVQVNGARTVKYGALCRWLDRDGKWALVYRNIGDPRRWLNGRFRRWAYRHVVASRLDGVVGVSESTLAAVGELYGRTVAATKIPRGIDPAALEPARAREDVRAELGVSGAGRVLLYAGSLTREKRVDRLLRLVESLAPTVPELRLWIAGDGPLRASLQELATGLGVGHAVEFLGVRDDVGTLMSAADVLVLASDTEGTPGVVLEAGWLGLPTVATDVGGVSECVLHGKTGLLAQPEDEEQFSSQVRRLLDDPELRQALGKSAHSWIGKNFTIQQVADRYVEFYRRMRRS